jgi:hypothetical protein
MTIPNVTVETVIQQHVTCAECGPLVIIPGAMKAKAHEFEREHLAMHKRKTSPIYEILEQWEDLKRSDHYTVRNRRAIDLHCKVDKKVSAHELGVEVLDHDVLRQLDEINEWILTTVFQIDPANVKKAHERT